jgi:hypothetical protein
MSPASSTTGSSSPSTGSSTSPQIPPFQVLTADHDDGEQTKRFGYKAPTLAAWLEIYMQDTMPDPVVGILLNLTPREVESLKSCIHQVIRAPMFSLQTVEGMRSFERELAIRNGDPLYTRPVKMSNLIRSYYATWVSLEFPHLFKEPASHREFRHDWKANEYGCYSMVPWSFRRDILVRLISRCVGEMNKHISDKVLRDATTDPISSNKKRAPSPEIDDTLSKRPHLQVASTSDPERGRPDSHDLRDEKSGE